MPEIVISPDERSATLVLADGERVSSALALVLLAKRGVRYGQRPEELARLVNLTGPAAIVVAEAEPGQPAREASIELPFGDVGFEVRPKRTRAGGLDFPELPVPQAARPGDVVAAKRPAMPGHGGRAVTGRLLDEITPPPGPPLQLVAGPGTELSANAEQLLATVDGNPRRRRGAIEVVPETRLMDDLDGLPGELDVHGNLIVMGNVYGGWRLRATGDITVLGGVAGASLAAGGRIVVHGGVRQHAQLLAGEAIMTPFLEGGTILGARLVSIRQDLVNTRVNEVDELFVGGSVVGGELEVHRLLVAKFLGDPQATPTHVRAMPPPPPPNPRPQIMKQRQELEAKLAQVRIRLDEARRVVTRHGGTHGKGQEAAAILQQLASLYQGLQRQDQALLAQLEDVDRLPPEVVRPVIEVFGQILPGAAIQVGLARLQPESPYRPCLLTEGTGQVHVVPLGSLEVAK